MRRTTVTAEDEDLAVLAHDAHERGVSLGRALGEVVARRAQELRGERRPHLGTFRAEASIATDAERQAPAARPFRSR